MRGLRRLAPAVVAAGVLLTGCSGTSGSTHVSASAKRLEPYLVAVRQAAASGDYASLKLAVRRLKHEVGLEPGISTSQQAEIDNAADAVLSDVTPSASATPTPSTTVTTPPPSTPPATVTVTPPATVTVTPPPATSASPSTSTAPPLPGGTTPAG
jgi:hypothetical protein